MVTVGLRPANKFMQRVSIKFHQAADSGADSGADSCADSVKFYKNNLIG